MKRLLREFLNSVLIILGIFLACMGLKGFLLSSNFIDGGVTGVSKLLAKTTGLPLAVLLPLVNLPFIAVGYREMGHAFAIRSTLAIAGLSLSLAFISLPDITPNLVLTEVFGGLFIGAGIAHTFQTLRDLRLNREANCLSKCGHVCLSCSTAIERAVRRYEPSPGQREGLALGRMVSSRGHQNS